MAYQWQSSFGSALSHRGIPPGRLKPPDRDKLGPCLNHLEEVIHVLCKMRGIIDKAEEVVRRKEVSVSFSDLLDPGDLSLLLLGWKHWLVYTTTDFYFAKASLERSSVHPSFVDRSNPGSVFNKLWVVCPYSSLDGIETHWYRSSKDPARHWWRIQCPTFFEWNQRPSRQIHVRIPGKIYIISTSQRKNNLTPGMSLVLQSTIDQFNRDSVHADMGSPSEQN